MKQRELESFEEFFGRALQLRRKLATVKVKVSDDDLATMILAGVSRDYVPTAKALSTTTGELNLDVIRVKLMAAEDRLGILQQQKRSCGPGNG